MMNGSVLVLNRNFQPVHVTSVKRGFSMLYQGIARAIDAQYRLYDFSNWAQLAVARDDECISTVSQPLKIPRVLVLSAFEKLPQVRVRLTRINIYARDTNICQYCGKNGKRADLNIDHVIPRTLGGKTTWDNVVCSCITCNLKKGGRTPEQAGMRLLKTPVRPRWTPIFRGYNKAAPHRAWMPFLNVVDLAYWNVELEDE
jgi:5-methylcytosine-specific restriction endonuclease McrA